MNGVPSTKLGGVASKRRVYGPRQNTFRFYRIQFPDNERNRLEDYYAGDIQNLNYLHLQDKVGGDNLLLHNRVTMTSNYFNQATIDAWLTYIRLDDSITLPDSLNLEVGHNPYIEIDFKYPQFLHSYSMTIEYMYSGWRILGSHDGVVWHYLQDVTPEQALSDKIPTTPTRWASRYQYGLGHEAALKPATDTEYLRWGIIIYQYGDLYEYSRIYTLEFRDGIGGTNLCVGGSVDKWASAIFIDDPEPFDGDDNTQSIIRPNVGVGYLFPNPVRPVTVAIRSGPDDEDTPNAFHLISSNNGKMWYYHDYYETPEGTWPSGSVTTQEIVL